MNWSRLTDLFLDLSLPGAGQLLKQAAAQRDDHPPEPSCHGTTLVWMEDTSQRPTWKRRLTYAAAMIAALTAFLATVQPAADFIADARTRIGSLVDPDPPPSKAEQTVRRYMSEITKAVPWSQPPTIFPASVDLFERKFVPLNPERVHKFSLDARTPVVDVSTVAQRAPQLQGHLIAVRARAERLIQVATYGGVTSWVYRLYDRTQDRVFIFCRVPAATVDEPAIKPGDIVYASGVLLADGGIREGRSRVLYMACSAIGRVTLMTLKFERGRETEVTVGKPRR